MKRFADIVEDVRSLSSEEQEELSAILNHMRIEQKRQSMLENHQAAMEELKAGKIKFYETPEDMIKALNED